MSNVITLGKASTKGNQPYVVKFTDSIGDTPVLPFFLKGYAYLIENNQAGQIMNGTNQSKAIYIEINNKVVGAIVFDIFKDPFNTAYMILSFVDENFRNLGLYNTMFKYFEQQAKKLGSTKIMSFVHINNHVRLSSKSNGMTAEFYRMEKRI